MITSPKGKSYIGQTIRSISERFKDHQKKSSGCVAIYSAIQKYGWEQFEKEWYECPDKDLNDHEELMIEVLGTLTPGGYNLKGGGGNGKLSEETKQKQREAQLGKTPTEESKRKMSEAQLGKTKSEEHRQKIGEAHLGQPKSEEIRQKISEAKLGEKTYNSKRVYQYDLDGTFIDSFGSGREAGRHLKKSGANISACARDVKGFKTAYNFKWSYMLDIFI